VNSLNFTVVSKKIYYILEYKIFQIKEKTLQKIAQKKALFSEASTPHLSSESFFAPCKMKQISPFLLYSLVRCPKQVAAIQQKKHFTRLQLSFLNQFSFFYKKS
jgi:hypothetical protein